MESVDPDRQTSSFSWSKYLALLIFVKSPPEQANPPFYRFSCAIMIQIFDDNFLEFLCERPSRLYLLRWLVSTGKPALYFRGHLSRTCYVVGWSQLTNRSIFKVKCSTERVKPTFRTSFLPKFFMDIGQDLSFGDGWSRWVNRPIFKVKRSPKRVNPLFCQFLCAIPWIIWSSKFSTSFLLKVFVDVRQDLSYGAVHGSFGDRDFQRHFSQKM
ncbi:hypothetical protein H5410_056551 [Solanum commersonii]|uniref:Uncharacterized protein n=1 Tax=Solanum commersonii TaxID=4109 RepID=A0A9J5WKI9_SOLCO|nr:hypothetical protein H5410_056551 [Solanum commersonii]